MSTTANTICSGALLLLGVVDPEDPISGQMLADAFRRLNMMMGQWALQQLTIPTTSREVFAMTAGKGSPTNPYTVGPGGDLDTSAPKELDGLGLNLITSAPDATEIPRAVLTPTQYEAIQIKNLSNSLFTCGYYKSTFPLGTLYLWPVPDTNVNELVLYRKLQLGKFTSQSASYELPDGADEAIEYNLAKRLLDVYNVSAERKMNVLDLAKTSLGIYKRSNAELVDQVIDPMFVGRDYRGLYNIDTGGPT